MRGWVRARRGGEGAASARGPRGGVAAVAAVAEAVVRNGPPRRAQGASVRRHPAAPGTIHLGGPVFGIQPWHVVAAVLVLLAVAAAVALVAVAVRAFRR